MPLPVIVAPFRSGVTQEHLNTALLQLIIDRIHELGHELTRIGAEVMTLGHQIEQNDAPSDELLLRALHVMDTMSDRVQETRQSLQHRGEALHVERAKSAAPLPEHQLRIA